MREQFLVFKMASFSLLYFINTAQKISAFILGLKSLMEKILTLFALQEKFLWSIFEFNSRKK